MNALSVILEDITDLIVDCPHSTAVDEGTGFPLVRTPNIGKGRLIYSGMHRVSEEVYNQRNQRAIPQKDDLIFAREATAGNVAIIKEGEKVCLGQRTVLIRPNKSLVSPMFLTYFLLAPQQQYNLLSTANGATVAHVNMVTIRSLKLNLPNIEIQRRIANVLSCYDSLIENYQKQIKLLEEAVQRIYKEWFVDFHFPSHENVKVVNGVPEGWEKKNVGELVDRIPTTKQIQSSEILKKGEIPVIDQSRNFIAGYTNDTESLVKHVHPMIVFGDHTRILKYIQFSFAKGADGTQLILSNDLDRMPQSLFYLSLVNIDLSNYSYARHFKYLKAEHILVPDKMVAKDFDNIVSMYFCKIQNCRNIITQASEARDRLLPKLMSGEIEI